MVNGLAYSNFYGLVYDTSDSQILHSTLPKSRKEAISQQRRSFILKYIMAVSNTYITIIFSNNIYTIMCQILGSVPKGTTMEKEQSETATVRKGIQNIKTHTMTSIKTFNSSNQ